MTAGGFKYYVNRTGIKETQEEGKMMMLAMRYTRLQEAEAGKGGIR